ncbi:MAG: site-specific integrase [Deltaproteobacteria bacterium HGW-Deltaproteobacteria-19]|jgi:integrase|nr:MAG: site-specific integrase [Deltaproteobacteria bacterium HGW-Deltaproteobacteria-19]
MGLFKRGTVWWMSFSVDGRQVRKSTETTDRKQAQRIFDKIKGEVAEGKWFEHLEGEDRTFNDLMDRYMKEHSAVNKAPRSYQRDKVLEKHLRRAFGKMILTEIQPKMIADYKTKRREEGVSPRTINYELILMGHAFNLAMKEWQWVNDNPVMRVRKERVNNIIERWLTLEEEEKLLAASPKWLQEIIIFAIHTGFRQGEILDLKWSQVDFQRRTVTLLEQKNRSVDTLPLNATALGVLQERLRVRSDKTDHVFYSKNFTRIDCCNLIRSFKIAIRNAKIQKLRFHDLRHTFATRLVQNGVDLFAVQKLGRWKSTEMIKRYAHHNPESLRARIEVMDTLRKPVITILSQPQKNRGSRASLRLVTP